MNELDKALDKLNKTVQALKTSVLKHKTLVDKTSQSIAKLKREQDNALGRRHLRIIH